MLQGEHSAILSTFIKLPFVIKIFVLSIMSGRFTQVLSYDVAFGSEITPCNKIDIPLVVYRFTGNVMTSITMLHTLHVMTKL